MNLIIFLSLISTPQWIELTPESATAIYAAGVGSAKDQNEALHQAYTSVLMKIGTAYFSILTKITSSSVEALDHTHYDRTSYQNFDLINWKGLEEAQGSPVINYDSKSETYKAYRLYKWSKEDLQIAKNRVKKAIDNNLQKEINENKRLETKQKEMEDEESAGRSMSNVEFKKIWDKNIQESNRIFDNIRNIGKESP